MAKLNKQMQKQTEAAESSGFDPLPSGAYHAKLRDVDTTREGGKGPYWSWEFEVIDNREVEVEIDGKMKSVRTLGRRMWNNTSLSEKAAFKMKETFEAFGVPIDTDTDEMIGKVVKLIVSIRTIQEGARKGELANQVDRLKPADPDVLAEYDESEKGRKEMEEVF